MSAGRFKVFSSCETWFQEYRLYHRDEAGRTVKRNDHLMDATRDAVRSGRARMKTNPASKPKPRSGAQSYGQDHNTSGLGWTAAVVGTVSVLMGGAA